MRIATTGRLALRFRAIARRLARDGKGSAAIEFALVSGLVIFSIIMVACIGLILYLGQALDYATAKAARQIMIGAVQKAGTSQDDFRTKVVCATLPAAMTCSDVVVNVQTASKAAAPGGYYAFLTSNAGALLIPGQGGVLPQYQPGQQGDYVYLEVIYPIRFLPAFMTALLNGGTANGGSAAYLAVSTAAFRNEQF